LSGYVPELQQLLVIFSWTILHFTDISKRVLDSIDLAAAQLHDDLHNLSQRARKYAVPTAAMKAPETFYKWIQSVDKVGTWMAICRKEGIHVSKARGEITEYSWNDDLAEELTRLLDRNLGKIATQALPELQKDYTAKVNKALKDFTSSLNTSSMGVTKHISNSLQNVMYNLERVQVKALREVDARFALAIAMSRIIDRKVPPAVRLAMKPGYVKASAMNGTRNPSS
jgi:predicted phage tail protein